MSDFLVSIIIPTYNRVGLIAESIKSALGQTHRNLEIIVVDDGSTDDTKGVVATFGPSIQYFYKTNSGPSSTRNLGIQKARGEFVAFLDSDDLWEPTKVEKQVDHFKKYPALGMVSTNYRYIDARGRVIKDPASQHGYNVSRPFLRDLLEVRFPFATPTFMIRKAVFNDIGFFREQLKICEDLEFLVRLGLKYGVGYIDEVLVSVRMHENHLMGETPRYQVWLDSVRVLESYSREIKEQVPEADRYFANFYSISGNSALLSGDRRRAFDLYRQAVSRHPLSLKGYKDCVRCFLPMGYLKARNEQSIAGKVPQGLERYK